MAWDDGDKGNPWRPGKDKGPADLDAVVRDLQRRLAALFSGGRGGVGRGGEPINGGLVAGVAAVLVVIWALSGFYMIDEPQRGVVLRFGAFQELTQPGLRWHLPWPIEAVEKVNIGATERVEYRGSMLTRDENIVNVDLVVQFRRTDPKSFLFSMQEPEDALKEVTASAIREIVGKNLLDFILTDGRIEVARETQDLLQATLDAYGAGVTVYEVNLQEANFPSQVETAVQDAIKAREDRERRILEAEGYRNGILPLARGEAEQRRQSAEAYRAEVVAKAQGESERFSRVLAEYQKAPGVTRERLYLETLEDVLARSTKVLVGTEGSNLLSLPLDQLLQGRTPAAPKPSESATVSPAPAGSTAPSRSRDRETR
jgi:membrane protease subunit HflK